MNIPKAAVYLRVSTDAQNDQNQEPDCLRICAARGWDPVFFRDKESGAKKRPHWEALKDAAHRAEVSAVVIWALDRAGRDRVQLAHDLAELARKHITVVSVREPWLDQPAGPLRDLLIQILAWFAEAERARIIERTRAGQARAWAAGARKGRPPIGQRDKDDPEIITRMRDSFAAGLTVREAALELSIPRSTLRRYWRLWGAGAKSPPNCSYPLRRERSAGAK